jgi:hypothetical protein
MAKVREFEAALSGSGNPADISRDGRKRIMKIAIPKQAG